MLTSYHSLGRSIRKLKRARWACHVAVALCCGAAAISLAEGGSLHHILAGVLVASALLNLWMVHRLTRQILAMQRQQRILLHHIGNGAGLKR